MTLTNQLPEKAHFDRILALELEITELRTDLKELMSAAKQAGIDTKLLRRSIKLALEDEDKKGNYIDDFLA